MYVAINKPRKLNGSTEPGEPGIQNMLDAQTGWYFPAGCLNRAASGIVILTNDPAHKTLTSSSIAGALQISSVTENDPLSRAANSLFKSSVSFSFGFL